jgi:nucleoid-associated protein YgaU
MSTTRSNLRAAKISTVNGNITIHCMFNPENYTVKKTNHYDDGDELRVPQKPVFQRYGRSNLTLSKLTFDTYETGADLTAITNKLWDLMRPADPSDPESDPPEVEFEWSTFSFKAFVSELTINYKLFDKDGNPVRAEVDITFKESSDPTNHPHQRQNPTSGGGPMQQIHKVIQGDRLDLIAAKEYGDATRWRVIAEYNQITNPRALRPGQIITIPPL